jgi:hypothetical protein
LLLRQCARLHSIALSLSLSLSLAPSLRFLLPSPHAAPCVSCCRLLTPALSLCVRRSK